MGGANSSRWHGRRGRTLCETVASVDLAALRRATGLVPGTKMRTSGYRRTCLSPGMLCRPIVGGVEVTYWLGVRGDCGKRTLTILYRETPAAFGGRCLWFTCPKCQRGCRVLYLRQVGSIGCRSCHGLAYLSQREPLPRRLLRRAYALAQRLGARRSWEPGDPLPRKPRPMDHATYAKLQRAYAKLLSVQGRSVQQPSLDGCAGDSLLAQGGP